MFIFRVAAENPEESSAIIMHEEGDIGRYNRANRSIHSFLDWVTATVCVLPFTFFVYPLPSFLCLTLFCLGRLIYQVGYSNGGFGSHVVGFGISKLGEIALWGLIVMITYYGF